MSEKGKDLTPEQYDALAEVRYQVRTFLETGEQAAKEAGLSSTQYQLLLSLKRHTQLGSVTLRQLSDRLRIRQSRLIQLLERLVKQRLVERSRHKQNSHSVLLHLTPAGEAALRGVSLLESAELAARAATLLRALETITHAEDNRKASAG